MNKMIIVSCMSYVSFQVFLLPSLYTVYIKYAVYHCVY